MKAFILMTVSKRSAWRVAEDVKTIPGVKLALVVAGAFDVLVELEVDYTDLGRVVQACQLHKNVTQTITMVEVITPDHS